MALERIRRTVNGREIFAVKGPDGGAHFHYTPNEESERLYRGSYNCGIEFHHKTAVYPGQSENKDCWLIGCDCFHDGSSLVACERFMPEYQYCKRIGDWEGVWRMVEDAYESQVAKKPAAEVSADESITTEVL